MKKNVIKIHHYILLLLFCYCTCIFECVLDKAMRTIANEINNFFVSIGHNLIKNIFCKVNPLFYVNCVNDSIVVQYVSVAQVRNVFTSLKDSSPG